MSASETMQRSNPNRRITSRSTRAPPTMTSSRPAGIPTRRARSATRSRPSSSHQRRDRGRRQDGVVDPLPVVLGQSGVERCQRRHRPGETDQACAGAALRQRRHRVLGGVEGRADRRHRGGQLLVCRRVADQKALGQAHTSDVQGDRLDFVARRRGDLGGPATDVDDHDRTVAAGEPGGGPRIRERTLLLAAQEFGDDTGRLRRGAEEVVSVGRVTHRRRGHESCPAAPLAVHDGAELAQGGECAFHGLGLEQAALVHALPEARDAHLAGERSTRRVRDQQTGGVGPAVECGDHVVVVGHRLGLALPDPWSGGRRTEGAGLSPQDGSGRAAPPPRPRPGRHRRHSTTPHGRGDT